MAVLVLNRPKSLLSKNCRLTLKPRLANAAVPGHLLLSTLLLVSTVGCRRGRLRGCEFDGFTFEVQLELYRLTNYTVLSAQREDALRNRESAAA